MKRFYPMHFFRQISFLCLIALALPLFSQDLQPAKWKFSQESLGNDEYLVHFDVTLDKGWNIYSQFIEEGGPIPTTFTFEKLKKAELIGKVEEKGDHMKEGMDPIFEIHLKKYTQSVRFTQKVKAKAGGELSGYVEFMTCDDEKCLPPSTAPFSFKFEGSDSKGSIDDILIDMFSSLFSQANAQVPLGGDQGAAENGGVLEPVKWSFKREHVQDDEYKIILEAHVDSGWYLYSQHVDENGPAPTVFTFNEEKGVTLIDSVTEESAHAIEGIDPIFEVYVKKYKKEVKFIQRVKLKDPSVAVTGTLEFMSCNDESCLPPAQVPFSVSETGGGIAEEPEEQKSFLGIFIGGFLGGLLALLTPCVFPMIPMTVSFFTKTSKTRRKGIINAFIYGLSIIVLYVSLGFLITVAFGSDALNAMASDIWFNLAFFVIFIVFAISFFGFFDITLPASLVNKVDRMSDKGGMIGIFFMAFTLSLVSFSCTGPIIGSLLVEAAVRGSTLGPLIGMLGFSLALALPFALFAMFPGWLNSLPQSGGWLNSVKVLLGFLELGLALKFLSNVDLAYHWNFLKREIFIAIWIIVLLGMVLYILGVIRFPHDGKVKKFSPQRIAFAAPLLALALLLAPGLQGAPLKLLSGFLPPGYYSIWNEKECPLDLACFRDLDEGIAHARKNNKPILVDFTGYTCANCRRMEEYVWADSSVLNLIKDEYVLISLYVDDKAALPTNQQTMSKCTKKKIKTLGNKWHDYQQCRFNQSAQPWYVLMTPDEEELTKPRGYGEDTEKYIEFLQEGLDKFRNGEGKLSAKE